MMRGSRFLFHLAALVKQDLFLERRYALWEQKGFRPTALPFADQALMQRAIKNTAKYCDNACSSASSGSHAEWLNDLLQAPQAIELVGPAHVKTYPKGNIFSADAVTLPKSTFTISMAVVVTNNSARVPNKGVFRGARQTIPSLNDYCSLCFRRGGMTLGSAHAFATPKTHSQSSQDLSVDLVVLLVAQNAKTKSPTCGGELNRHALRRGAHRIGGFIKYMRSALQAADKPSAFVVNVSSLKYIDAEASKGMSHIAEENVFDADKVVIVDNVV